MSASLQGRTCALKWEFEECNIAKVQLYCMTRLHVSGRTLIVYQSYCSIYIMGVFIQTI